MTKKILVIMLAVILLVAGCKGAKKQVSISDIDLQKGFDGLTAEFFENAPPKAVFENSPFPAIIKLQNKGAYNIEKDKGALALGVEKDYVNLNLGAFKAGNKFTPKPNEDRIMFGLDGKTLTNPIGEQEIIELDLKTKEIGAQSEIRKSSVFATACYDYGTKLGTEACVDTDIYNLKPGQKACSAKELNFADGQGAPVAVTKIETQMLPAGDKIKPHFIIHVENKGNGEVIKPGSYDKICSKEKLDYAQFNLLSVKAFLSEQKLDCVVPREEGFIKLKDKKSIIRCTFEEGVGKSLKSYTAPLRVELSYGYTFTVSKEFTIERILKY